MSTDAQLAAYFAEADGWQRDQLGEVRRSARRAWWVAALAGVACIASTLALVALVPLKRIEPYLIRVDRSSGVVDVVPALAGPVPADEAVARYFLTHYVLTCERFNFATAESDYDECGAFNGSRRNQAWAAAWANSNPASPLNLHKDGSVVSVRVRSVSFFRRASGAADLAQVRFTRSERLGDGPAEHESDWIATVRYAMTGVPREPLVRRWNPLGFKVVEYVTEPESPPASLTPAATDTASATAAAPPAGAQP